jgi:hypothetical protein
MRVGRYPTLEEEILNIDSQATPTPSPTEMAAQAEATPAPTQTPPPGATPPPEQPPTPTPEPVMPEVIVLAVEPQDALVINFAWEINANVAFALRAVGDEAVRHFLEPVTLPYLMETYNIAVPPKLQYGVQPPVGSVEDLILEGAGAGE